MRHLRVIGNIFSVNLFAVGANDQAGVLGLSRKEQFFRPFGVVPFSLLDRRLASAAIILRAFGTA
jgi:hypothetical protein